MRGVPIENQITIFDFDASLVVQGFRKIAAHSEYPFIILHFLLLQLSEFLFELCIREYVLQGLNSMLFHVLFRDTKLLLYSINQIGGFSLGKHCKLRSRVQAILSMIKFEVSAYFDQSFVSTLYSILTMLGENFTRIEQDAGDGWALPGICAVGVLQVTIVRFHSHPTTPLLRCRQAAYRQIAYLLSQVVPMMMVVLFSGAIDAAFSGRLGVDDVWPTLNRSIC